MLAILTAAWLCMPLAPLNPIEEDTLAAINLHATAGISTPSKLLDPGPEITLKWEMLAIHPLVVRSGFEYQYGSTDETRYPGGNLHMGTMSLSALYYRGTDKLTGYIGLGPIYRFGHIQPTPAVSDSLLNVDNIVEVDLKPAFGYRLTLGLRYQKVYSLEFGFTQVESKLRFASRLSENSFSRTDTEANLSSVRITLGYVFTLRQLW